MIQALLMVHHEVPSEIESLIKNGRLNKAMVFAKHPKLMPLIEVGMKINMWIHQCELRHPRLADLSQRALNVKYSTQQGEDAFQILSSGGAAQ